MKYIKREVEWLFLPTFDVLPDGYVGRDVKLLLYCCISKYQIVACQIIYQLLVNKKYIKVFFKV